MNKCVDCFRKLGTADRRCGVNLLPELPHFGYCRRVVTVSGQQIGRVINVIDRHCDQIDSEKNIHGFLYENRCVVMPRGNVAESSEDDRIDLRRQSAEVFAEFQCRLVRDSSWFDASQTDGNPRIRAYKTRQKAALLRVEIGICRLRDLADVVPRRHPLARTEQLLGHSTVVEENPALYSDAAE